MTTSVKRKKVTITMEQKLQALFRIDAGESLTNIAQELGVGKQTVSDWKKNRNEIENFCAKMVSMDSLGNRRTLKKPKNNTLDEALYVWFCQQREQGVPLSGATLQAIAIKFNEKLNGDPNFNASVGWLSRWKIRHGIREIGVSGEILSGDKVASEDFKIKYEKFVCDEGLLPCQIFNADETGLQNYRNYKMLQKNTLASKLDSVAKGHKVKKERVTSGITHGEATAMLEQLMTYFEKQSETSPAELLTIRRLRHRTSKLRHSSLKQKNITDFFQI